MVMTSVASKKRATRLESGPQAPLWLSAKEVWNPNDDPGFLFSDIARQMRLSFERRIVDTGLTGTQWRAMVYLFRKDGLTQTELASEVDVERASMGSVLDKLEIAGFVTRRDDPQDRRIRRVFVTAKATALIPKMAREASGLYAELFSCFSPEERNSLISMLTEMRGKLRKML